MELLDGTVIIQYSVRAETTPAQGEMSAQTQFIRRKNPKKRIGRFRKSFTCAILARRELPGLYRLDGLKKPGQQFRRQHPGKD